MSVLLRKPVDMLSVCEVFIVYDTLQVKLSLLQVQQFIALMLGPDDVLQGIAQIKRGKLQNVNRLNTNRLLLVMRRMINHIDHVFPSF